LRLSQPSVSAALRRLEAQLGLQLFLRTRRGVQLTPAGDVLLKDCHDIVDRLVAAPARLRSIKNGLGGSVLVRTISHIFSPALDAGLMAFKARYPDVELVLETDHSERIVASLMSGESSVAVGFDERPHSDLRHVLLLRERQPVYCGRTHELFGRTINDPRDLAHYPFVVFSNGEPSALRDFRNRYGLGQRIGGNADNMYEAGWLIGLGIGIGNLPEPMVDSMLPGLSMVLPPTLVPELDIFLMWRADLQDRAAQLLVETILEHVGNDR
jgi:DNA-binding transcriptional LysR family regulator